MDYLVAAFSEAELDIATKIGANRLERHRLCIEILEPCGRNLACRGVLDDAHFRRNFDQVVTYEVAQARRVIRPVLGRLGARALRSEEHTSELQSLMRISYAVFCLKKKTTTDSYQNTHH